MTTSAPSVRALARWRAALSPLLLRNLQAGRLVEQFLVSAVASVLTIRLYLELTGYPQIGGGVLHIAHLLWGGLLMLVSLIMLLSLLPTPVRTWAAIVGGIGFGAFIDELGKFITQDNNYFFQPTISIIYIVFVLLFLVGRALGLTRNPSDHEFLINAIELTKDAAGRGLNAERRERILALLAECEPDDPVAAEIRDIIIRSTPIQNTPDTPPARLARWAARRYHDLISHHWFGVMLIAWFLVDATGTAVGNVILLAQPFLAAVVAGVIALVVALSIRLPSTGLRLGVGALPIIGLLLFWRFSGTAQAVELPFSQLVPLVSTSLSAGFVVAGASQVFRHRVFAYAMFRRATMISIFVTQVFSFYLLGFGGLIGLASDLVALTALDYMVQRERAEAQRNRNAR
ncbi:MAG: hypothetical protein U0556_15220 [Dehalococcoidia bacterium]